MIVRLFYWGLIGALVVVGFGCKASPGVRIPILMYHRIGDAPDDFWTVSPSDFEAQLQYLKMQGYESILPRDLADGNELPAKPVIITFDDGYLSLKTHVEPVLEKYGFRGVVYLVTRFVTDDEARPLRIDGNDCLTWPEVRELRARGTLVFGAHSHTHLRLDKMADPFPEIETCFQEMVKKGGFKPDSFCYPFGGYNPATVQAVKKAGFTTAMTCGEDWADTRNLKPLKLPRLWVRGGVHRFSVERLERLADHSVICVARHQGISIPVTIRLTWAGEASGEIWQNPEEVAQGEQQWRWKLPQTVQKPKSLRLEIWDKNRFFSLYAYP
jgi:peptidoglycan/xylan/chitin deacetylase (PgdA/CDA1 family)